MKKPELPIETDCDDCQAMADANVLFKTIEEIAIDQGMHPDRMLKALRELLTLWCAITWSCWPEDYTGHENEIEALAEATQRSAEHRMRDEPGCTVH